ncbi:MAG: tripartite tricarboxylate transporter TctB family protein [Chloroflexi bacterium]|nr:tripartite tricarboxylate transporter TctB family protein [Chloroflexota bacterium]
MRFRLEALFTLFVVGIFAWAMWEARIWPLKSRLFPWAIGIPVLALALTQLVQDLRRKGDQPSPDLAAAYEAELTLDPKIAQRRSAAILGWIVGFFLAIWLLGFPLTVVLGTFLYLKLAAGESWLMTILVTVVAWGFFNGLFDMTLHIPFPEGELLSRLGWPLSQ